MEEYNDYYVSKLFTKGDFIIEIKIYDYMIESWLQHKEYGVSSLMFGIPYSFCIFDYNQFIKNVENNLDNYIAIYEEEVMKGEIL